MRTTAFSRQPRGLAVELRRTFGTLWAGLLLVGGVLALLSLALLGFVQPDLRYDTEVLRTLRLDHAAMLDRQSGLRAWLMTSDEAFLDVAARGERASVRASDGLVDLVGRTAELDRAIIDLELASQTWTDRWAEPVAQRDPARIGDSELTVLFAEGDALFQPYRDAQELASGLATDQRDRAMLRLQQVIAGGLGGVFTIVAVIALILRRQFRRMDRRLGTPIRALVASMEAIRNDEPIELNDLDGPEELQTLARQVQETSETVRRQRRELEARSADSQAAAVTLRSILAVAREIAGSLSVRYVAESVASGAATIAPCDRVVVWLSTDDQDLVPVHDSSLAHGAVPNHAPVALGAGGIGVVARDARPQWLDGSACFPLVVGGRVMGVLELAGSPEPDPTTTASLETLANHAAAALEAARLHRATEELAQVDALTRLLNRRRLDGDLATELDRANRYGRPLGFVLLDLDHFKRLNDTFGHQHGDEVLRRAAECLAGVVRSSDTVYRYGGEEFAVLVREGTRSATEALAERLRVRLVETFAEREGFTPVTASFGVSMAPEHGRTAAELILAADSALYVAKDGGRNQVVVAPLGGGSPSEQSAEPDDGFAATYGVRIGIS